MMEVHGGIWEHLGCMTDADECMLMHADAYGGPTLFTGPTLFVSSAFCSATLLRIQPTIASREKHVEHVCFSCAHMFFIDSAFAYNSIAKEAAELAAELERVHPAREAAEAARCFRCFRGVDWKQPKKEPTVIQSRKRQ